LDKNNEVSKFLKYDDRKIVAALQRRKSSIKSAPSRVRRK